MSERAGITKRGGTYGLGVSTLDFDDDGWTDLYVANDSNPSALYRNNHDGTFEDVGALAGLRLQPGRQAPGGHGRRDRRLRPQRHARHLQDQLRGRHLHALREHRRRLLRGPDLRGGRRHQHPLAGLGRRLPGSRQRRLARSVPGERPRLPRGRPARTEAGYKQRKVVYRNLAERPFEDVSERLGPPATTPRRAAGAAFGDFDNDGDVDVVVNNVNDAPDLFRLESTEPLADAEARGHALEPQRDRRARALRRRRAAASRRGPGRRQLHLAERLARALRPGRGRARRAARGALAERPRGALGGPRGRPHPDARGGQRQQALRERDDSAALTAGRGPASPAQRLSRRSAGAAAGGGPAPDRRRADPARPPSRSSRPWSRDDPRVACCWASRTTTRTTCEGDRAARAARRAPPRRVPLERREAVQVLGLSLYLVRPASRRDPAPGEDARVGDGQPRADLHPRDGLHPDAAAGPGAGCAGPDLRVAPRTGGRAPRDRADDDPR